MIDDLTYLQTMRLTQTDRTCDASNPESDCYQTEEEIYNEAEKWQITLDDGSTIRRAPTGPVWGLVFVGLLAMVIFIVRSMALASANKEVS
jgi:hypothetical protein